MQINQKLVKLNFDEKIISKIMEQNLSNIELNDEQKQVIEIAVKTTLAIIESQY